jgi:outer membrane protein assembly factor BamB
MRLAKASGLTAAVVLLAGADWPQWMGPNRDDVWPETGIVDKFPEKGPPNVWRVKVGGGYAGPAVANGKVYVPDRLLKPGAADPKDPFDAKKPVASSERVLCLDARTGKELWKHEYDCPYQISYPAGPRCTPTVHGGKVYTLGAMGHLFCLDADTGKVVWAHDLPAKYGTKQPYWGYSGHPLVYKDTLIVPAGGKGSVLVAFHKDTGAEVWKALDAPEIGYSPPTLIEAGGTTQLVYWSPEAVNGLNPDTGAVYWKVPLKPKHAMAIMAPRQAGDYLYAGGLEHVAVLLKLDPAKPAVTEVWRADAKWPGKERTKHAVYPINMTPFAVGDVLYGVDQPSQLVAVKLETGDRLWSTFKPVIGREEDDDYSKAGTGTAFLTRNGDRFFIFAETGDLIIAKLTPDAKAGYTEVSRARLLAPTGESFGRPVVWSHPAYADKCVFARNDKEVVCYSLAK